MLSGDTQESIGDRNKITNVGSRLQLHTLNHVYLEGGGLEVTVKFPVAFPPSVTVTLLEIPLKIGLSTNVNERVLLTTAL